MPMIDLSGASISGKVTYTKNGKKYEIAGSNIKIGMIGDKTITDEDASPKSSESPKMQDSPEKNYFFNDVTCSGVITKGNCRFNYRATLS